MFAVRTVASSVCRRAPTLATAAASSSSCNGGRFGRRAAAAHTLPDLSYDYGALEPAVSAQIMELHHSKHHNTYVTNLNVAEEKYAEAVATGDVSGAIGLQGAIKFNGGGHINHTIFWTNLCPPGETAPVPDANKHADLVKLIEARYGSIEAFKTAFAAQTAAVQGSGWGWLGYEAATNSVKIATTANQDPLEATTGLVPLLGVDVWEHAYYLDYKNVRPDYLNAIWDVVSWDNVSERLVAAQK